MASFQYNMFGLKLDELIKIILRSIIIHTIIDGSLVAFDVKQQECVRFGKMGDMIKQRNKQFIYWNPQESCRRDRSKSKRREELYGFQS